MDVVYICRNGDNEELRYSIRSVIANMPHSKIWVVGGKPDWYTGNHIAVPQENDKYTNARNNMRAIASSQSPISPNFVLMNDDFFILKPIKEIKYYYGGLLVEKIAHLQKKYRRSSYINMLIKSKRYLFSQGIRYPKDYTLHVPFVMNKVKLRQIVDLENISWRLAYGNLFNVGGIDVQLESGDSKDVKIYWRNGKFQGAVKNSITDIYLSTEDRGFPQLIPMLEELFPNPSEFEK